MFFYSIYSIHLTHGMWWLLVFDDDWVSVPRGGEVISSSASIIYLFYLSLSFPKAFCFLYLWVVNNLAVAWIKAKVMCIVFASFVEICIKCEIFVWSTYILSSLPWSIRPVPVGHRPSRCPSRDLRRFMEWGYCKDRLVEHSYKGLRFSPWGVFLQLCMWSIYLGHTLSISCFVEYRMVSWYTLITPIVLVYQNMGYLYLEWVVCIGVIYLTVQDVYIPQPLLTCRVCIVDVAFYSGLCLVIRIYLPKV